MRSRLAVAAIALGLALAACGESDEEKAQNTVCDARADIQKQVDELQNLTIGTATTDQIKSNLDAIKDDLGKISGAQDQLDDKRKQQVQQANQTFKSQVDALAGDLGKSQSLESAAQQLKADLTALGNAYKQSFAQIDC
jgi:Tfp pilus assembly protein PilP